MVIDIHTHLWPLDKTPSYLKTYFYIRDKDSNEYKLTCEGLLSSMDESGIEKAVVLAISFSASWTNKDLTIMNEYVLEQTKKSGNRLIPFCTINPFEENAVFILRKMIEDDGFRGLKLHCNMQQFYPNDIRLYPIYELMQGYNKPIIFHSGGIGVKPNKDRFGQPIYFDDVACDFPNLSIILGHAGRIWYEETAMLLRKHKNVFADISTNFGRLEKFKSYPMNQLLSLVKGWAGTTENLIFGSDYPFYSQKETFDLLIEIMNKQPDNEMVTAADIKNILLVNSEVLCNRYGIV